MRKRIGGCIAFCGGTLTSACCHRFEAELAAVVALSFLSRAIGTGGNAGAQTVMTVIRSLALGSWR